MAGCLGAAHGSMLSTLSHESMKAQSCARFDCVPRCLRHPVLSPSWFFRVLGTHTRCSLARLGIETDADLAHFVSDPADLVELAVDDQVPAEITAAWQRACVSLRKDPEARLLRAPCCLPLTRSATCLRQARQACLDFLLQLARQTGSANPKSERKSSRKKAFASDGLKLL